MVIIGDGLAREAHAELASGTACVDLDVLEALATQALEARTAADGFRGIAEGQGLAVAEQRLPAGVAGVHTDGLVIVGVHPDAARVELAGRHETGHAMLKRAGMRHAHADVWALTLMLAVPRALLGLSIGDAAVTAGAPWWAVQLRRSLAGYDLRHTGSLPLY